MAQNLVGRVIVITGASSGIGAATALACARAGMHCVLNARRAARLAVVAEQVRQLGRGAETVVGDVTGAGMSERLLDAAERSFGRFDVVLANAGYGLNLPVHELDDRAWHEIFEVNFFAAVRLLREAACRLIARNRPGHLLMTSSCAAKFALPNFAAYTATKAAQSHVCRAMRMELRPYRIEVSSVHPLTTRTEFFEEAARRSGQPTDGISPADRVPRWFVQSPERVASAIVQCLRHPVPEVWTSHIMRILAAVVTLFPSTLDLVAAIRPRR